MSATCPAAPYPGGLVEVRPGLLIDPAAVRALWRRLGGRVHAGLEALIPDIFAMAGFLPDEGEALIGQWVFGNVTTDKGTNLDLNLFTNVAPGETIAASALTRPSGTGYAAIALTDGSWTGAADTRSYAQQTFTGGAGGWTGSIQGYDIVSKGTTPRILAIEVDANGPYTINENDTYKITPNITFA